MITATGLVSWCLDVTDGVKLRPVAGEGTNVVTSTWPQSTFGNRRCHGAGIVSISPAAALFTITAAHDRDYLRYYAWQLHVLISWTGDHV